MVRGWEIVLIVEGSLKYGVVVVRLDGFCGSCVCAAAWGFNCVYLLLEI